MSSTLTSLLIAVITTGTLLQWIRDLARLLYTARQKSKPEYIAAEKIHVGVAQADESVIVVARARDLLAQDNARLRMEIEETAKRHASERAEWFAERSELRRDLDGMEERLRATLAEVHALRIKHNMTEPAGAKGGK